MGSHDALQGVWPLVAGVVTRVYLLALNIFKIRKEKCKRLLCDLSQ